jgi:hypothetical protein
MKIIIALIAIGGILNERFESRFPLKDFIIHKRSYII